MALVHDYLTQRGGAERVVLSMLRAFPGAPLYTSLYWPEGTFPEFASADIRVMGMNRLAPLRRWHRLGLPILAPSFSRLSVDADVVLCSSSGWAHGVRTDGLKIVYCYAPARWVYQPDIYPGPGHPLRAAAAGALRPWLRSWDQRAAHSADRYLTSSAAVRDQIRSAYGLDAIVLPPPSMLQPEGPEEALDGVSPGYLLSVSRLLPYKHVDDVVRAMRELPAERLVVVGDGPEAAHLRSLAAPNARLTGVVSDAQLRWLYRNAYALVAASYEDYGITPLEAAAFGKPVAVLRGGGYLDTVVEGKTGVFFEATEPGAIAAALRTMRSTSFDSAQITAHAKSFSDERFVARLREVVREVVAEATDA